MLLSRMHINFGVHNDALRERVLDRKIQSRQGATMAALAGLDDLFNWPRNDRTVLR